MVTMVTIAISSALIGVFLSTLLPKYRSAHQGASWREALQGAEAGINHGINELNELAGSGKQLELSVGRKRMVAARCSIQPQWRAAPGCSAAAVARRFE
jgi:hypothetical protein